MTTRPIASARRRIGAAETHESRRLELADPPTEAFQRATEHRHRRCGTRDALIYKKFASFGCIEQRPGELRSGRAVVLHTTMRILIVEDDPRLSGPVADDWRQRHRRCRSRRIERLEYASAGLHDLILLDVMLPGESGLNVCRRLREAGDQAMIVMITALDAIEDKVAALDAGADDYIVKPFDLAELSARIRAVGRRTRELQSALLRYNEIALDPRSATVSVHDQPVPLTRSEFIILDTLMRHGRQLFTRQMLHDKVTSLDRTAAPESIRTHIGNLRRKLRAAGCMSDPIETVYGSGYRFTAK